MDLVLDLFGSMDPSATTESKVEMPCVVPMDVTHVQNPISTYGATDAPTFVVYERCTPKLILDLIEVWRAENVQFHRMEAALRAFQAGTRFRVACGPTHKPEACEISFENERWVWLSGECVYELAQELFN